MVSRDRKSKIYTKKIKWVYIFGKNHSGGTDLTEKESNLCKKKKIRWVHIFGKNLLYYPFYFYK